MRIGVMVGPERGRYATKVDRLRADGALGRGGRLRVGLGPADPRRVRRPHRRRRSSGAETTRIEIGTAVVPVQPRHPIALAQQALSVQAVCGGRLALGLGVSHHWIIDEMLGLPYEQPGRRPCAPTSTCSTRRSPGPGRSTSRTSGSGCTTRSTSPTSRPRRCCSPPSVRRCCGSPASAPTARSSGWPTSGPSAPTSCRTSPRPPRRAGRPAPRIVAGIPVCLCGDDEVDAAVARTNRILSEAEVSPNYQRLLDLGDARERRRHPRRRQRVRRREAPAIVRRRRRHRRLGPGRPDRRGPRRAARVAAAHPRPTSRSLAGAL